METIQKVKTMKTINATKGEFVNLINGLYQVQEVKGKDFSLNVSKNISILHEKLKDVEKAGTPTEEFLALAKQVNEIAGKESEENAKKLVDKLEEENKELVDSRKAQLDKVAEMMKEEVKIKLHILTEDSLPEDITAKQINNIVKIIE